MISTTMLSGIPSLSLPDAVSNIIVLALFWGSFMVDALLGVIMITRLYAMYQRSRKMLIIFIALFLALTIVGGVMSAITSRHTSGEELVLSGTYQCIQNGVDHLLVDEIWILGTVWEILALCFAVWIVVKHFLELRRSSTGWTMGDCFMVLMQTHAFYFAAYATVSCFNFGLLSPKLSDFSSTGTQVYYGIFQITVSLQMSVLGPRLILSVRDCNVKLFTDPDTGTGISTIAFQERAHDVSTGGDV
ncbi:hypothetical protein BDR07DRAFT_164609 [Suillus spraguei]|nr:hypothetical protein BDR07DRAFT_164609 [Suillus spraguei]